jgi:nucleotide-binding universal stress UspA family protein
MRILTILQEADHCQDALKFLSVAGCSTTGQTACLHIFLFSRNRARSAGEKELDLIRQKVRELGLQADIELAEELEEIHLEAQHGNYDLIVIAESSDPPKAPRFRNTLAIRIAKEVSSPALILKGELFPLKKILLCDSGADRFLDVRAFLKTLIPLVEDIEEITVLHVMSQISAGPGVRGKQLRAEADELMDAETPEGSLLADDINSLTQSGVQVTPRVRHGLVVEEILAETDSGPYDLLVIGYAQQEGWQRLLLTDIGHQILSKVKKSILLVKN